MKMTYEELNANLIRIMADLAELSEAIGRDINICYYMKHKPNKDFTYGVERPYCDITVTEPNDWDNTYQHVQCHLDELDTFDFPVLKESAKEKEWRDMWEDEMRADCIEDADGWDDGEEEEDEEEDDA
jgi:hypothetical protein